MNQEANTLQGVGSSQNSQILLAVFLIAFIVNLIGEYLIKGDDESKCVFLRWVSKPLLMVLLIGLYITAVPTLVWFAVFALAFGWIGDIFLMFDYQSRFYLLGSGAFLLGHISYILDYSLTFGNIADFALWRLALYLPVLLIFLVYAFPRINGRMKGKEKPVTMIYGAILLLMALATLFRLPVVDILDPRFLYVWIGALLFVLSDAILSVDRFHKRISRGMVWIMSTYAIGQFFIVYGLILLG
jgi:uncharacterized membrane protein YhhN